MLIDLTRELTPSDSKTHIRHSFRLPGNAAAMRIHFTYGPKLLENREEIHRLMKQSLSLYLLPSQREIALQDLDAYAPLRNLLTLSVDDEQGYRGACHRQDPEQHHLLSESEASPGLMKGPVAAGEWSITVSCHSVVTETCRYTLQVEAVGLDEVMAAPGGEHSAEDAGQPRGLHAGLEERSGAAHSGIAGKGESE